MYTKQIAAISILATAAGIIIWYLKSSSKSKSDAKKNKKKPQRRSLSFLQTAKWENAGKLTNIWIYPIKSCAGIEVKEAVIEKVGPQSGKCRDRSFLIVDEKGNMITARKISSTLLISSEFEPSTDNMILTFPNLQPIKICLSLVEIDGKLIEAKVWNDTVRGFDCGDEAADWLTLALGCKCRLLFHGSLASLRTADAFVKEFPMTNTDDNSLYGDLSGSMLMNKASLLDLEERTSRKLPAQNFRPNFLVNGSTPFEEDDWTYIKIGEVTFRNIKPCTRCIFTTIDYMTAKRDKKMEPLKTLKKYRLDPGSDDPKFGINLGVDKVGRVKVGDDVYVFKD